MIRRGSLDLLGPSTKAALEKLQAGVPVEETGRTGTTNGDAMRIAPVGIAHAPGPGLLAAVVAASQVTHSTGLGISGAAAIAAALVPIDIGRDDPFGALCTAASIGGDTDTVGAMAGAVLGALHGPSAFPADAVQLLIEVSGLADLADLATDLLAVR